MPEAVRVYLETGSFRAADDVKRALLSTFRDDFSKYGARVDYRRLDKVYQALPGLVGSRFRYVRIDRDERSRDLAPALDLLCRARVAQRVYRSAANGVPLGAELDERRTKLLFLDVGLVLTALGLSALDLEQAGDAMIVGRGAIAEQFVGQHLLYGRAPSVDPDLYFWAREKKGTSSEVDYVVSVGPCVVPVEVKAGATGRLKSLHVFLEQKGRTLGVRLNSEPPSLLHERTAVPGSPPIDYQLLSLPLYLVGQLRRLVRETLGRS